MKRRAMLRLVGGLAFAPAFAFAAEGGPREAPKNVFFPFNNSMRSLANAPKTPEGQAKLLKELGYVGLEGYGPQNHRELKSALKKHGLKMPSNYTGLQLDQLTPDYLASVKQMIAETDKGEVIWLNLRADKFKGSRDEAEAKFVAVLKDLARHAAPHGVKLGAYPHTGFFCATVEDSVRLAKKVDANNYGAVVNLCHLLKVEGSADIEKKIDMALPWLVAVSINGADGGDTKKLSWKQLIQPLGQGSFDVYGFLAYLWDKGYSGPIGLQCYNVKGDVREVLGQSMKAWREYRAHYAARKNEKGMNK